MPFFLSYQFRERALADDLARQGLPANAPLDGYDQRVRLQVASPEAQVLKEALERQIAAAEVFICIIGPTTATSSWVNWEVEVALKGNKRLLILREDGNDPLPPVLSGKAFEPASQADPAVPALPHLMVLTEPTGRP
jgi:hypothetical protein